MRKTFIIAFMLLFGVKTFAITYSESQRWDNIDKIYTRLEKANALGNVIVPNDGGSDTISFHSKSSELSKQSLDLLMNRFDSKTGEYLFKKLPVLITNSDMVSNKQFPSIDKKEAAKYITHGEMLTDLYYLSCFWRETPNTKIANQVLKSLEWYMTNMAPERPYWRLTMRFTSYSLSPGAVPILGLLDRIIMNMTPIVTNKHYVSYKDLFCNTLDYTDHLTNFAVGAQNRGVNWSMRMVNLFYHYFTKYPFFGKRTIYEFKNHLYDGLEYDPSLSYSEGMGTLIDGGFWHHGPQPYLTPYGQGDTKNIVNTIKFVEGTILQPEKKHYAVYEKQLLDKWQYVIFADHYADLAIIGGKQVSQTQRGKGKFQAGILLELINTVLKLDKDMLDRYDEIIELKKDVENGVHEKNLSANRIYWLWEYMLHRRNGWYIGYKGLSNATKTSEWASNFHLSSGMASIIVRGDEYESIRGAINWTALPGITAEQYSNKFFNSKSSYGASPYCNGVTNNSIGMFAFTLSHNDFSVGTVNANKAAFFFDKGMVNLSSNINKVSKGENAEVWTSIDNRKLYTKVYANINDNKEEFELTNKLLEKRFVLTKTSWFWQDSIGYVIPVNDEPVEIIFQLKETPGLPSKYLKEDIGSKDPYRTFLLAINHSRNPKNCKAEYYAFPKVGVKEMNNLMNSPYVVKDNSDSLQVVFDASRNATLFAARKSMSFNVDHVGEFTTQTPLIAMVVDKGNEVEVTVSCPTKQKLGGNPEDFINNAIELRIPYLVKGDQTKSDKNTNSSIVTIPLSSVSGYQGKPVTATFIKY